MEPSASLAALETSVGNTLAYTGQTEWGDECYQVFEYYTTDGKGVEVKLDPVTGQPRT